MEQLGVGLSSYELASTLNRPFVLSLKKRRLCNKRESCGGAFIRNVDASVVRTRGGAKDNMKHPRVPGPLIQQVRVLYIDQHRYYIWSNPSFCVIDKASAERSFEEVDVKAASGRPKPFSE